MENKNGLKILVVPDSHADYKDKRLDRFDWLGKMIVDEQPDIVVDIGDRADMPSLSVYDKGTKGFEGRRYTKDLEAVHTANKKILAPLRALQKKQRKNKKKVYQPELIITLGNHEHRILRACNSSAELDGFLSYGDLQYDGWDVYDFLEVVERGGVLFSHYFVSGLMGTPIGGVNSARSHINKLHRSTVSGHSHLLDYSEATSVAGQKFQTLVCGCYLEDKPEWASEQQFKQWSSGICILDNVKDGNYDLRTIGIKTMEKKYGSK